MVRNTRGLGRDNEQQRAMGWAAALQGGGSGRRRAGLGRAPCTLERRAVSSDHASHAAPAKRSLDRRPARKGAPNYQHVRACVDHPPPETTSNRAETVLSQA